jgi:hypothetical protein
MRYAAAWARRESAAALSEEPKSQARTDENDVASEAPFAPSSPSIGDTCRANGGAGGSAGMSHIGFRCAKSVEAPTATNNTTIEKP